MRRPDISYPADGVRRGHAKLLDSVTLCWTRAQWPWVEKVQLPSFSIGAARIEGRQTLMNQLD